MKSDELTVLDLLGHALAYGHGKSAADHVAQDIVDDDIGRELFDDLLLLEKLDGRNDASSGAADPRLRAASLYAENAVETLMDDLIGLHPLAAAKLIKYCGHESAATQGIGGIALRVAADLHDLVALFREGSADVGGGRGLANASLSVYCNISCLFHYCHLKMGAFALESSLDLCLDIRAEKMR